LGFDEDYKKHFRKDSYKVKNAPLGAKLFARRAIAQWNKCEAFIGFRTCGASA
jgi:hypothetical protein